MLLCTGTPVAITEVTAKGWVGKGGLGSRPQVGLAVCGVG